MTPIRHIALFVATAFAVSSVRAGDDDTHLASSYMRAAISAGLPKYEPKRALVSSTASPIVAASKREGSSAEVTSMPEYTVRESKLPTTERVLTYKARTRILMDGYMGDSDGLDRGVLNRYTLAQLWAKIPILGKLPFIGTAFNMSVEERALDDAGANNPVTGGSIRAPDQ